jgi:FAD/FMN-containing dehydrogenase
MRTRRDVLNCAVRAGTGLALLPYAAAAAPAPSSGALVNDIHSQLNETRVDRVVAVESEAALRAAVKAARRDGKAIAIAGGRHSMGGQQFASGAVVIDTRPMRRELRLDAKRGIVEADAGIQWPELVDRLIAMQKGKALQWGIVQKQTGADRLTLGGALSSNIHGRGLKLRPFIGDVEAFTIMDGDGALRTCSRAENRELFRLAIGGYGLFGVVTRVRLRLMPRTKLERVVEVMDTDELMAAFNRRMTEGYLYGDCQFSTDVNSDSFLQKGVFSCYRPLPPEAAIPAEVKELGEAEWRELYYLSHADTRRAYETYVTYYLSTSGQRYWSDTNQMSLYLDDYHAELDCRLQATVKGTEMISELYVPRAALAAFLAAVRADFRQHGAQLIYGTIRLIEKDDESFLAWAREPWVCTVMNLHVDHDEDGRRKAADHFRRLIDRAIEFSGSYFLTYHRWATRRQVEACYPQMAEFLRLKRRYDPREVFQSDGAPYSHPAVARPPHAPPRSVVCRADRGAGARRLRRADCPLHPAVGRHSSGRIRRRHRARRDHDHVGRSSPRRRYLSAEDERRGAYDSRAHSVQPHLPEQPFGRRRRPVLGKPGIHRRGAGNARAIQIGRRVLSAAS